MTAAKKIEEEGTSIDGAKWPYMPFYPEPSKPETRRWMRIFKLGFGALPKLVETQLYLCEVHA